MSTVNLHRRKTIGLILRSACALGIVALDCFLMVWTGGELLKIVGDPMIALVPIVGFGALGFLAVHYLFFGSSLRKSQAESQYVQPSNHDGD